MNILHVCANPKPVEQSVSKQLAARFFGKVMELNPEVELTNVDLYQEKPPFYSNELYCRMWNPVFDPSYEPTKAEDAAAHYANKEVELLKACDVLVLTMPMWNFTVPAVMKAWMDQILAPGLMFDLTEDGPKPLHTIKTMILLISSGGVYKEDDDRDALSRQVRAAFGFIGIDDIRVAWADGQNSLMFSDGELRREMALDAAEEIAEDIAEELAADGQE